MPSVKKITAEQCKDDKLESTVKHSLIGSVSMGTDDTCVLIERFMAVLESHAHPDYDNLCQLLDNANPDEDESDDLGNILDMAYNALDSLALDGYYFGADGMGNWNYGFWVKTW